MASRRSGSAWTPPSNKELLLGLRGSVDETPRRRQRHPGDARLDEFPPEKGRESKRDRGSRVDVQGEAQPGHTDEKDNCVADGHRDEGLDDRAVSATPGDPAERRAGDDEA